MLSGMEILPISYKKLAQKLHLRSAPLLLEEVQKRVSKDPAADSGLRAVSLLQQHSLLALDAQVPRTIL